MKSSEQSWPLFHESSGTRALRKEDFRCCFCCHVRTATICYGLWHVVMHILLFLLLWATLYHPNLLKQLDSNEVSTNLVKSIQPSFLIPHESKEKLNVYDHTVENSQDHYTLFIRTRQWGSPDIKLGMFITLCTFILTLLLLHGTIKSRPSYLMPFFCFQLLDLGISLVALANYFSNTANIRNVVQQSNVPFKKELLDMDPYCLNVAFLLCFICVIFAQTYFINLVWSCYKYLVMRDIMRSNATSSFTISDLEAQLPPDYDTAIKLPKYYVNLQTPPPPYPADTAETPAVEDNQVERPQQ